MFCAIVSSAPSLCQTGLLPTRRVASLCQGDDGIDCTIWASWVLCAQGVIHIWKSIFVYVNVEIYLLCSSAFTLFLLCILCVWCWSSVYRARHILLCTHTDTRFGCLGEDRCGVCESCPEWPHSNKAAHRRPAILEETRSAKYLIVLHVHRSSSMILYGLHTWASVWYLFWIVDGLLFSCSCVLCPICCPGRLLLPPSGMGGEEAQYAALGQVIRMVMGHYRTLKKCFHLKQVSTRKARWTS